MTAIKASRKFLTFFRNRLLDQADVFLNIRLLGRVKFILMVTSGHLVTI